MGRTLAFTVVSALLLTGAAAAQTPAPAPSASAQGAAPAASPALDQTLVPRGTLVVVETTRGNNSYGAQTGSKITFTLVQDVIVDGHVVAKTGDVAEGAIQNAQAGQDDVFTQRAANLRVSVDKVYNFCGDVISTDFMRSEYRRRQGFFGSHKDVEIAKGQMYQVPTERPQRVCSERTSATPAPIPSNALLGDKN